MEKNNSIAVYPNPAKSKVFIETTKNVKKAQLVNITGRLVLEQIQDTKQFGINSSDFKPGIYFIKVYSQDQIVTRKLVIE